jgi:hypothetical protein
MEQLLATTHEIPKYRTPPIEATHDTYVRWFGDRYDLLVLDTVLATAAAAKLTGSPPWLLVLGGSGSAKTETLSPLKGAGAYITSTLTGEQALLSGTPKKDRAESATGGLLSRFAHDAPEEIKRDLLILKDLTSILSMGTKPRNTLLAALREVHDGQWTRQVGVDGGVDLEWSGRLVLIAACTTAWDAHHKDISTMGDRFVLIRFKPDQRDREAACDQAIENDEFEHVMKAELLDAVSELWESFSPSDVKLSKDEVEIIKSLANVVTLCRTSVHYEGNSPAWAHAPEMPTRLAKQLVQIRRGGLALGLSAQRMSEVIGRCAADTMPPVRLKILLAVRGGAVTSAEVTARTRLPRSTVDRTLLELVMLGALSQTGTKYGLSVDEVTVGMLAPGVSV